jgi:hypothetical protein
VLSSVALFVGGLLLGGSSTCESGGSDLSLAVILLAALPMTAASLMTGGKISDARMVAAGALLALLLLVLYVTGSPTNCVG